MSNHKTDVIEKGMTKTVIKYDSKEDCVKLQEKLFELGYEWCCGGRDVTNVPYKSGYIFVSSTGLSYSSEDYYESGKADGNYKGFTEIHYTPEPLKLQAGMEKVSIHFDTKEEFKELQQRLFGLGYKWTSGGRNIQIIEYSSGYIHINANDCLSYCGDDFYEDYKDSFYAGYTSLENWKDEKPEEKRISVEQFMAKVASMYPEAPPIGLRPRHIAEQERSREILEAVLRYVEAGKKIPNEWMLELREIFGGRVMDFKKMSFKIDSPEHSEKIQKALFDLGYSWYNGMHVQYLNSPSIETWGDGLLSRSDTLDFHETNWDRFPHTTLDDILPKCEANLNPKASLGAASLPMTKLSPLACAMGALGKLNGALKYGTANYIGTQVVMSIYLDAIRRHFDAILMGEDVDPVDKVPHWGAIMANIDIILCAEAAGTLVDDRPRADGQLEAVRALKPLVASLQELHKEKNPKHYLMKEV